MNTVYLHRDELNDKKAELKAAELYYIFGENSIFVPKLKTSYVDVDVCKEWPNLDGEIVLMTPGQAARTELKRHFPEVRMVVKKSQFELLDIAPPMYFRGPVRGDLCYLDLKGAYHQIYRWMSLDCVWPRGQGMYKLCGLAHALEPWKSARNTLVGVTRSHTITAMKKGKLYEVPHFNPYFNPALWCNILSVLHEIANRAIELGAVYVATDCYIFRSGKSFDRFNAFLRSFDMVVGEVAMGDGHIRGWASYSVGRRKTRRQIDTDNFINNIERKGQEGLKWLLHLKTSR